MDARREPTGHEQKIARKRFRFASRLIRQFRMGDVQTAVGRGDNGRRADVDPRSTRLFDPGPFGGRPQVRDCRDMNARLLQLSRNPISAVASGKGPANVCSGELLPR